MSSLPSLDHELIDGCLTIRLRNGDILLKMEPTIRQIAGVIEAQRPKATLIDFRAVPPPTGFIERYQLGELAGRYLAGHHLAVLVRPDQADRQRIGKVVATNRGVLLEVFLDQAAAEAWLALHTRRSNPAQPA